MDFLGLAGKTIIVFGVANKKSVAWHIGKTLEQFGATVVYVVRSPERKETVAKLMGDRPCYICDVEFEDQIESVRDEIKAKYPEVHGLVHSIAFAAYDEAGIRPFHETTKNQFLRTIDISCYSFIALANAKSFSQFSQVRFNAVSPGLLKTSASAGIPGYVDSYLFAEKVIPRGTAVSTQEVADAACFLLSPRSSGITAQKIVIDAGMAINYFDKSIVSSQT